MASIPVVLLMLVFLLYDDANAQQNHSDVITLGSSLSPSAGRTSWLSPSGHFAFGFYPKGDGFAIGIWLINEHEKKVIWTANRDDSPVLSNATLELTRDGKLLLKTEPDGGKQISEVEEPAASAAMLDSGNFVLYNKNSSVIWESFYFPTDTILGGQNLSAGDKLVSSMSVSDQSSGRFFLAMQLDGNLAAYPINRSNEQNDCYWTTVTWGTPYRQLRLNGSGVLFLAGTGLNIRILANSSYLGKKHENIVYRATLDPDGIFRMYLHHFDSDHNSSMLVSWSALSNQCEVKGFCGINSYCSGMGGKAYCKCYPGFDFFNTSSNFLGCRRNFSDEVCWQTKDPLMRYVMVPLDNVWLGDFPYSVVSMKKEYCSKSCLEDCHCRAALYAGEDCTKYKLPLRYGRSNKSLTSTAYIKVSGENVTTPSSPLGPEVITKSKRGLILALAISLGCISCVCFIFAICSLFTYRHLAYRYRSLPENAHLGLIEDCALRSFSYNELETATDGFKEELGRGSFGAVYKGTIPAGNKTVAVKRLETLGEEGQREFQAEMTTIARTHHRNLVRLLGFCVEGSRKLLVYEYMSNGSLADLLFKAEMRPIWKERARIAQDVARGILYLHEQCEVRIIHSNIKPQNILMDDTWTAKISDFGLAKLLLPNQSRTTLGAESTTGRFYLAPEWHKKAMISVKADIYSFGIVLLEIICCRGSIEVNVSTADEIILSSWVYDCFVAGELHKVVGDENVDSRMLERMVKVGLWCIQEDPDLRPLMKNVILMLEGTMDIPVPPSPVVSNVA